MPPSRTVGTSEGRVPTDGVEREVDPAHRLSYVQLRVVEVFVGAETEHEVAIAG